MSHSLSKRFVFGPNNVTYLDPFSIEHDFYVGIPNRQRQLVAIGLRQEKALRAMQETSTRASAYILDEIAQAADGIANAIETLQAQQERDAAAIRDSIECLQNALLAELSESRWLLLQIENRQSETLRVLTRPRATQAEELMQQALSNLTNGYFREAVDRLLKALEFDNTDYQVHRNLGYAFVHEGNAVEAAEHFSKAVSFAPTPTLKLEAICDLARVYYAEGNYLKAARTLQDRLESLGGRLDISHAEYGRVVYTHAAYYCLASQRDECLGNLKKALDLNAGLFSRAWADDDFSSMRADVTQFLQNERHGIMAAAEEWIIDVRAQLAALEAERGVWDEVRERTNELFEKSVERMRRGSYADLVVGNECLSRVSFALAKVQEVLSLQKEEEQARAMLKLDRAALNVLENAAAAEMRRRAKWVWTQWRALRALGHKEGTDVHYDPEQERLELASKVNDDLWRVMDLSNKVVEIRPHVLAILGQISNRLAR